MKILLVSDTHGETELLLKLSKKYQDYTKIHLGDRGFDKSLLDELGFIYVDGNCDYGHNKDKILNIENNKIFITHGDLYNVKYDMNKLYYKALSENANYVFFGHTHFQINIREANINFINPGSLKDKKYAIITDDIIELY